MHEDDDESLDDLVDTLLYRLRNLEARVARLEEELLSVE